MRSLQGRGLHLTTRTGKEAPVAAGVFSNQSHTYPWELPYLLLESPGRKRLWVAAICSRAVTEQSDHTQNRIWVISAQKPLLCHFINCQPVTCFIAWPEVASHNRFFPPNWHQQAPGTELVWDASLVGHGTQKELAFSLFPKADRPRWPQHQVLCLSVSPSPSLNFHKNREVCISPALRNAPVHSPWKGTQGAVAPVEKGPSWKLSKSWFCSLFRGTRVWAPLKAVFKDASKCQWISYWHQLVAINHSGVTGRGQRLPASRGRTDETEPWECAAPGAAQPALAPLVPICLSTETPSNQGQPLPQPFIVGIAGSWIHFSSFPDLCHGHWKQRMEVVDCPVLIFLQWFPVHLPLTYILTAQPSDPSQIICIKQTHRCLAVSRWAPSKSQDLWLHPKHPCHGQDGTDSPTVRLLQLLWEKTEILRVSKTPCHKEKGHKLSNKEGKTKQSQTKENEGLTVAEVTHEEEGEKHLPFSWRKSAQKRLQDSRAPWLHSLCPGEFCLVFF